MATVTQVFDDLQQKFEIDDKTRLWLTADDGLAAKGLDDFMYAVSTEQEVASMIWRWQGCAGLGRA